MDTNEYLVEGEKLLYTLEGRNENLYITDRRVIYTGQTGTWSKFKRLKDIDFHHISSIELSTASNEWIMIVGALLIVAGIFLRGELATLLVIGGVITFYFYIRSLKSGIVFVTEYEKVLFNLSGSEAETHLKEITKIIRSNIVR